MQHEDNASGDSTVPRRTVLKTAAVSGRLFVGLKPPKIYVPLEFNYEVQF